MRRMRLRDESGQAVLEFALVLPLLLTVVTAIVQLALVFNSYLSLTDAVRSGARTAAVSRSAADPVGTATNAVRAAAGGMTPAKLAVQVSSTWQAGGDVTVSATYPYSLTIFGIAVKSGSLTSSTTERVE